ncbi:MAG: phosphoesterase [Epsilonproteobacteria bacterium]|nr:phosphoesterase [Campylobacterota bacterium]NPA57088.1 phosphoesterase [Campylobacterota bacterium]
MRFYHLSHTDLDGYTCQFLTRTLYPEGYFVNANYGEEVLVRIDEILREIERDPQREGFFLITDLNLTREEASYLDRRVRELNREGSLKLQLLDHHLSGLDMAMEYSWYHLDLTKSATMITYEYFLSPEIEGFERLVKAVNAVDIWLREDPLFEFGKVLMRAIDEAKEINRITFPQGNIAYRHHMLKEALPYLDMEMGHIPFDDTIWQAKKRFFIKERNDTLDNLVTEYILELLTLKREQMTIHYRESKGILTYGIQNSSIIGNAFLRANPDFHFFMNVTSRGTFSLRADNQLDVAAMADQIAGGGGHPNASGGRIKEFQEFFTYEELKSFMEHYLKERS